MIGLSVAETLSGAKQVYSVHSLMCEELSGKFVMLQLPPEDFRSGEEKWEAEPGVDTYLRLLVSDMFGTISGLYEGASARDELQREVREELDGLPVDKIEAMTRCVGEPLAWPLSRTLQLRGGKPLLINGLTLPLTIPERLVDEVGKELLIRSRKMIVGDPLELISSHLLRPFGHTLMRMVLELSTCSR